jgi:hypothetical protein
MSVLDELRSQKSKFICLNDNMEHGSENETIIEQSDLCKKALKDVYLLPHFTSVKLIRLVL